MREIIPMIGKTFSRLTVIAEAAPHVWNGKVFRKSRCRCVCGKEVDVLSVALRRGKTKSCGCFRVENTRAMKTTHGHSVNGKESRTYKSWTHMIERCLKPKTMHYKYYGGRGIRVCERWLKFENFLEDMGVCHPPMTIDRIDNNGNYEPGNCRWITQFEQAHNKRNNRIITVRGFTGCFQVVCRHFNVPDARTRHRLSHGWSIEEAFFKPRCNTGIMPKNDTL